GCSKRLPLPRIEHDAKALGEREHVVEERWGEVHADTSPPLVRRTSARAACQSQSPSRAAPCRHAKAPHFVGGGPPRRIDLRRSVTSPKVRAARPFMASPAAATRPQQRSAA